MVLLIKLSISKHRKAIIVITGILALKLKPCTNSNQYNYGTQASAIFFLRIKMPFHKAVQLKPPMKE